jgi:hypothetical protein
MSDLRDEISLLIIGSIDGDSKIFIPISLAEQIASKCCDVAIEAVGGEKELRGTEQLITKAAAILAIKEAFNQQV